MQVRWGAPASSVMAAFGVAVGLYLLVVLAFRIGERRTVAELAPFDLAAIIAVGAVVGGTATGRNPVSIGVTAVAGLLLAHAAVTRLRRLSAVRRLIDQSPVVLICHGQVQPTGLRRAGLTRADLDASLRADGIRDLRDVEIAIFETRRGVSVLLGQAPAPLWHNLTNKPEPDGSGRSNKPAGDHPSP